MSNRYKDKNCLVFGTGVSGRAAAGLLIKNGARVTLFDQNEKADKEAVRASFDDASSLNIVLGTLSEEEKERTDILVLSPGVPLDNPLVTELSGRGVYVTGEIELGYELSKGELLAITGTNGKTTTTTLLGEIMKAYARGTGRNVLVVGNIGDPYTLHAPETTEETITVAEISSFQLETIHAFKPRVSAVLNVTPDHLNRHHSMENYAAVKKSISLNQDSGDTLVLNYDDPITRSMAEGQKADVVFFTGKEVPIPEDRDFVHIKDGAVHVNARRIVEISEIKLLGKHNLENVMAAVAMAVRFGVPDKVIRDTVRNFKAVEHRIEFVRNIDGVDYYNDSKGTNPDAAIKAVEAMVKPTILIGGGYDKKSTYDEFIEAFEGKVKLLILIGETAEIIKECALRHGFGAVIMADDLRDAVNIACDNAVSGDAVLLSPACASWDMFKNYEERGRLFKEYVSSL